VKPVIIQTEARIELAEGMAWYDEQQPGVGRRLQAEVELAVARLRRNPEWCPPHKQTGFRKMTVNRFPYAVFFVELPECIWVAAIANLRRRPDYWMGRRIE
jgi:hypothetical protein